MDGRRRVVSYDREMGGGPGGPMDFERPAGFLSGTDLCQRGWELLRLALWLVMCAGGFLKMGGLVMSQVQEPLSCVHLHARHGAGFRGERLGGPC